MIQDENGNPRLRSRQESLGIAGATTSVQTRPLDGASTSTQVNPDGTSVVSTISILANGNTQTTTNSYSSLPSQSLLSSVSNVSDALGRTLESTNGRGHVTQYAYHGAGGQLASTTQVNAAPGGGNLVTSQAYTKTIGSGTLVTTTLPDGTHQYQETNLLGQTVRQWGSQINPVSFTYDAAGRKATLTTYRAPVGANADTFPSITGDTTSWTYDDSGVLLTKTYADGKGTSYTYDIAGRMLTRTWARGVVTTYAYVAGQLTSTTYSNDPANTPSVAVTYDRLGRQVSSTSLLSSVLQSSVLYAYDPATLALDTETVTIDPDGPGPQPALTRILDRGRDTLGRECATGILPVPGGAAEHFTNYGYDNSGRLSTVTSPAGTFQYAYLPNSNLIQTVTGPVHTVTNTWEPNRDVLASKENKINSTGTPVSAFTYGVNPLNQRTGVQTSGTAFQSQPANWNWGYDPLGQVVSADSPTPAFDRAYQYDAIGNRTSSTDNTALTTYAANALNQYSQISPPSPSSPVVPLHDDDGNQIDAQIRPLASSNFVSCVFHWDAENRLIAVKDKATNEVIVSYTYDSGSRRVARTEGSNTTLYLYDGWNSIAEYLLQNSSVILQTSHTWGLDLSSSLQGAGGVGGLLVVTKHEMPEGQGLTQPGTKNDFYPNYDGNDNVSEYISVSGTAVAHYEYDPFGRTVVASGVQAADFERCFSTKPLDPITGLYYYAYRSYDPYAGRWLSRDLIEENGGLCLYAACNNNLVSRIDLLGMTVYPVEEGFPLLLPLTPDPDIGDKGIQKDNFEEIGGIVKKLSSNRWRVTVKPDIHIWLVKNPRWPDSLVLDIAEPQMHYLFNRYLDTKQTLIDHERDHARITVKHWNVFVPLANAFEGVYCSEECANLAKIAINNTRKYYMYLANVENANYDYFAYHKMVPPRLLKKLSDARSNKNDAIKNFGAKKCIIKEL